MAVSSTKTQAAGSAPSIAWHRTYAETKEKEYELNNAWSFTQTTGGGYALFGEGARITETGPKNEELALIKADGQGEQQWVGFADPGSETHELDTQAGVETSDGGYGLVGWAEQMVDQGSYTEAFRVAVAGKVGPDGEEVWAKKLDALEEDETSDNSDETYEQEEDEAMFFAAAPDDEGGFVAFGNHTGKGWFVHFAADGTVAATQKYDADSVVINAHALETGYRAFTASRDAYYVMDVDETGTKQSTTTLDLPRSASVREFITTADGGYAYAATSDSDDMMLGKLAADGSQQWENTYDGPYEGLDASFTLTQTEDGGYTIAGRMSEAYSGDAKPAVVKTDGSGSEQWRKLFKESENGTVTHVVQADDGGVAALSWNHLTKLAPTESEPSETPTASPTATPSESPSDTPTETPEEGASADTPEETPTDAPADDSGSGTTDDAPTDTPADDATGSETETPTDSESGSTSGDDCTI